LAKNYKFTFSCGESIKLEFDTDQEAVGYVSELERKTGGSVMEVRDLDGECIY